MSPAGEGEFWVQVGEFWVQVGEFWVQVAGFWGEGGEFWVCDEFRGSGKSAEIGPTRPNRLRCSRRAQVWLWVGRVGRLFPGSS
ncbi:hypothetical protein Atai01_74050 [Amycolatopsis taiwanensis]|uniref:Uncharacterized protein n=1 Tax=Amycolatopsis taiwanensis TaxID=342230 RepID=A0A9W6R7Y1_9PSEU|nr:hypothetical protein Atai01_74050 [Amycolatopsis taiwanensis]